MCSVTKNNEYILDKLVGVVSGNGVQNQQVGNAFSILWVLLYGLLQGRLGLLKTAKMYLANSLADEAGY